MVETWWSQKEREVSNGCYGFDLKDIITVSSGCCELKTCHEMGSVLSFSEKQTNYV